MRRAALVAIASLALAGEGALQLPEASAATKIPAGAAIVNLDAKGEITVEKDGKPVTVSLDHLAQWLRPEDEDTKSEKAVLVRADGRAPWRHVCRILETCAERKLTIKIIIIRILIIRIRIYRFLISYRFSMYPSFCLVAIRIKGDFSIKA